jgi:hypothetical protein
LGCGPRRIRVVLDREGYAGSNSAWNREVLDPAARR